MTINMPNLSTSYRSSISGVFHEKVETNNRNIQRTNQDVRALNLKKETMDNNRFIDELKSLLQSRFNNDIDKLAKCLGRPANDVSDFMNGLTDIPPGFIEDLTKCLSKNSGGERVQFGDKYVEINNTGDGYTNYFDGMMKGAQIDIIKKMKLEMSELKKIIKSKEETIKSYEEMMKSKDELIEILKEQLTNK